MAFIEIEKSVHKNDWSMQDLHSHPHYEIYFLREGSRSFFLSNALFNLQAPIIIIIPPHTLHKTEGGPFERYNVNVSPNYLDDFQKEVLKSKSLQAIKLNVAETEKFTELFEEMMANKKRQKFGENIVNTLFSYNIYAISKLNAAVGQPKTTTKNAIPPLVLKVIDYLNKNYAEKQTLEEIANNFFVSKATLMYNFKKYMDCSLIDFLLSIRIAKAKELLLNTKKSVEEISELCGFSSSNYFGLIFKRKENLSPANYRKHQKNKQ